MLFNPIYIVIHSIPANTEVRTVGCILSLLTWWVLLFCPGITGVRTAGELVVSSFKHQPYHVDLRRRFDQLQEALSMVKLGLSKANHPHILSDLRRNVRAQYRQDLKSKTFCTFKLVTIRFVDVFWWNGLICITDQEENAYSINTLNIHTLLLSLRQAYKLSLCSIYQTWQMYIYCIVTMYFIYVLK